VEQWRPLTEEAVAFLKDWIEQRQLTDPEAIVFPFVSASSLTGAFRKASKRAKIKDLRLHDLRHDWATRFWKTHKDLALR
jgi:integrase